MPAVPDAAPSDAAAAEPVPDVDGMFRLDDQVVLITGASSGLGARFARVCHAAGARVVVGARRLDRLEALAATLPGTTAVACDVARDADLQTLVDRTIGVHGRVDVLINNAGIGGPVPAEDEAPAEFRRVVDVNLNALFVLSQLVGRHMIDQGHGVIVNIASMLGLVASAPVKQASYTASKGAVVNLTRELGAQWARKGIRVNALAPGWFPSEMAMEMFTDPDSIAFLQRNAPMGRGGRPDELDGPLLFLASSASSYITGQIVTVDGGWTAR